MSQALKTKYRVLSKTLGRRAFASESSGEAGAQTIAPRKVVLSQRARANTPTKGYRYTWYPATSPKFRAMADDPANKTPNPGWFLTLEDVSAVRKWVQERRQSQRIIGFVPTMGALHRGHLDLVKRAAEECDDVIVSIYVNPTQFGANEDLSTYPRPFRDDLRLLGSLNESFDKSRIKKYRGRVTAIFNPIDSGMYPFGHKSQSRMIIDPKLTQILEGQSRPTFFQGVTTIVLKLLNIVMPDYVYFGQKDIQQVVVIRRMIEEFHLPVIPRAVPTTREPDGLALSSRNLYLGPRRRKQATALYQSLMAGDKAAYEGGIKTDVERKVILDAVIATASELQQEQQKLPPSERVRFEIDYVSIADPIDLQEVSLVRKDIGAVLSAAMIMLPLEDPQPGEVLGIGNDEKSVRLIDNVLLGRASMPLGVRHDFFRKMRGNSDASPPPSEA